MKTLLISLCWLSASLAWAEAPQGVPEAVAPDPVIQRLQALQTMRARLEQDWAGYLHAARANTNAQPMTPAATPEVRQMRQEVTHNLERLEDRFRCLDVDLNGNNGNVVLVCGDNQGPIGTNNQQAFGADLSVSGGGQ